MYFSYLDHLDKSLERVASGLLLMPCLLLDYLVYAIEPTLFFACTKKGIKAEWEKLNPSSTVWGHVIMLSNCLFFL